MPTTSMRAVLRGADVVVPQAYSAYGRPKPPYRWSLWTPGHSGPSCSKARRSERRVRQTDNRGAGRMGARGMVGIFRKRDLADRIEHTLTLRASATILGARYWSWKHIAGLDARGGRPANGYGLEFFRRSVSSAGAAAAWTPATAPTSVPSAPPVGVPASSGGAPPASRPTSATECERESDVPVERQFRSAYVQGDDVVSPQIAIPTPEPRLARQRVLQTVQVELPLTRERIQAAKLYDRARDTTAVRAVHARGAAVDLAAKIQAEVRAWLRRHRQVHPVLARAIQRLSGDERVGILAWIFHEHELARKDIGEERPLLIASRETLTLPRGRPIEPTEDTYTEALRASIRPVLDRARSQFRELGVEVSADLGTVPVLVAQATKSQVEALSRLPDVTGLYLHETRGIPDCFEFGL